MQSVSYIMPCFITDEEVLQATRNAIESCKQAVPTAELVIVDNGSTVGGGYLRSEASLYVRLPENQGFAPAIRYGLAVAQGEILAPVNNDVRVAPNWLAAATPLLAIEKVATVHFRMTNYDEPFQYGENDWIVGKERWCHMSFFATTRKFLNRMVYLEQDIEPYPGLFDCNYQLWGYDDWDFHYRVRKWGFMTAYTNKSCFQHLHSLTARKIATREEKNRANREYFKTKHGTYPEDHWQKKYPHQMEADYWKGFSL